jgi:hypothetical protein
MSWNRWRTVPYWVSATETLKTYVQTYMVQSLVGLPAVLSQGILVNICYEHTWWTARLQPNVCHQLHCIKEQISLPFYLVLNIGNTSQCYRNYCILNLLTIKRIVTLHTLQLPFFISSSDRFTGAIPEWKIGKRQKFYFLLFWNNDINHIIY